MKLRNIIWCIATLLLVGYLVAVLIWTGASADGECCAGMDISIADSTDNHFVTEQEIVREIDSLSARCAGMLLKDIDTDSLERLLNSIDKIEHASCVIKSDGRIAVSIVPMQPVARVFEGEKSYYINREGKRISADARYFLDVPVISGNFDSTMTAMSLLPLVDYIAADPALTALVSMIKVDSRRNIILVPEIRGHVINFGDTSNVEDKFYRLQKLYCDVIPKKGWNYYDTIAVKWNRQVVATKRAKKLQEPVIEYDAEIENEVPDIGSMMTDEDSEPENN